MHTLETSRTLMPHPIPPRTFSSSSLCHVSPQSAIKINPLTRSVQSEIRNINRHDPTRYETRTKAMKLPPLVFAVAFLLLACAVTTSNGSLLPFLDRVRDPLWERFPDPFRVLEHIPFGLERDDVAAVAPARVDWKETPSAHQIVIDVPGEYYAFNPLTNFIICNCLHKQIVIAMNRHIKLNLILLISSVIAKDWRCCNIIVKLICW